MIDLITYLDKEKIVYELNKSTKELVSFKIGGIANIVIYPDKTEQLPGLISLLKDKSIKYCILGNGTNTYFSSKIAKTLVYFNFVWYILESYFNN